METKYCWNESLIVVILVVGVVVVVAVAARLVVWWENRNILLVIIWTTVYSCGYKNGPRQLWYWQNETQVTAKKNDRFQYQVSLVLHKKE